MKFFTYDLLTTINNESFNEEKIEAAELDLKNNSVLYAEIFHDLADKLPSEVYKRFKGFGFHDYQLEKLIIDHSSLLHTNIDIILENEDDRWKLSFTDISTFKLIHLNQNVLQPVFDPTLDTWAQEEFIPLDGDNLSLEVLFNSGANIQIIFNKNNITMQKL